MTNAVTITAPDGVPFIRIEREFDAPVDAVFRANADPDLVKQWLGPNGYEMIVNDWEFGTNGRYAYTHRNPEGAEFGFRGVFHTVKPNELIIQTFEYDGVPDVPSLEIMRLVDLGDGRTKVVGESVYPSVESRDAMVQSGMEHGVVEGYERLDALLGQ